MIEKLHFYFRLEEPEGFNFLFSFTSIRNSLKVIENQIHTSFSGLGELKPKQEGAFLLPLSFVSGGSTRIKILQQLLSIFLSLYFFFFFYTFLVKATTIVSGINLQMVLNMVKFSGKIVKTFLSFCILVLVYMKCKHALLFTL